MNTSIPRPTSRRDLKLETLEGRALLATVTPAPVTSYPTITIGNGETSNTTGFPGTSPTASIGTGIIPNGTGTGTGTGTAGDLGSNGVGGNVAGDTSTPDTGVTGAFVTSGTALTNAGATGSIFDPSGSTTTTTSGTSGTSSGTTVASSVLAGFLGTASTASGSGVASAPSNGVSVGANPAQNRVIGLFNGLLDRNPQASELTHFTKLLRKGVGVQAIRRDLLQLGQEAATPSLTTSNGSTASPALAGASVGSQAPIVSAQGRGIAPTFTLSAFRNDRTRTAFVDALYAEVLDRGPSAGDVAFWTGKMQRGLSRKAVLNQFLSSPEFLARFGASPGGTLATLTPSTSSSSTSSSSSSSNTATNGDSTSYIGGPGTVTVGTIGSPGSTSTGLQAIGGGTYGSTGLTGSIGNPANGLTSGASTVGTTVGTILNGGTGTTNPATGTTTYSTGTGATTTNPTTGTTSSTGTTPTGTTATGSTLTSSSTASLGSGTLIPTSSLPSNSTTP